MYLTAPLMCVVDVPWCHMTRYQEWMNKQNSDFIREIHSRVVPERYINEYLVNKFTLEELELLDEKYCLCETQLIPEGNDD